MWHLQTCVHCIHPFSSGLPSDQRNRCGFLLPCCQKCSQHKTKIFVFWIHCGDRKGVPERGPWCEIKTFPTKRLHFGVDFQDPKPHGSHFRSLKSINVCFINQPVGRQGSQISADLMMTLNHCNACVCEVAASKMLHHVDVEKKSIRIPDCRILFLYCNVYNTCI